MYYHLIFSGTYGEGDIDVYDVLTVDVLIAVSVCMMYTEPILVVSMVK